MTDKISRRWQIGIKKMRHREQTHQEEINSKEETTRRSQLNSYKTSQDRTQEEIK